jgi:hypothetical protein
MNSLKPDIAVLPCSIGHKAYGHAIRSIRAEILILTARINFNP